MGDLGGVLELKTMMIQDSTKIATKIEKSANNLEKTKKNQGFWPMDVQAYVLRGARGDLPLGPA